MFLSLLGLIENEKASDEHSVATGLRSCEYRSTAYPLCREGKPKAMSELKCRASLVAQMVKNLSATWDLGQEDPLEKGMATYSSILAWEIPWTEETSGLQPRRTQSRA